MKFNSNFEKLIFFNLPVTLFSLIPLFLITGPFLSDLSVSLISLLFLIYCLKKKIFSFFKNNYFYFFLIFYFYLVINSLINNFNIDSFKISFFYFRYGVFIIAIIAFLNTDCKFIKYFFYCIFICFSALIIDGYYQYFYGENILGWKGSDRTSSFFGDEYVLGSYLSRLWPLLFGLYILIFQKKEKFFFLFYFILILTAVLIFLSGDRAAFFYINLSVIFIIIFSNKLSKLGSLTFFLGLLLILIISFFNSTAKERVVDLTLKQVNLFKEKTAAEQKKIYIFTKAHHELYITAYKIFKDNLIFGVGVKNFRNICKEEKYFINDKEVCNTHPHNTYIQILTEIGIFGFMFLLILLIYFVKYLSKHLLFKIKRKYYFNDFEICILSGIAIYLWPLIPTGNVFSNWLNIFIILYLPFLFWSRKRNNI